MSTARLHLVSPDPVADFARGDRLREAFVAMARLAGAEFSLEGSEGRRTLLAPPSGETLPILYRGQAHGQVRYAGSENGGLIVQAAGALAGVVGIV